MDLLASWQPAFEGGCVGLSPSENGELRVLSPAWEGSSVKRL